jgi:hypothetical protein
VVIPFLVDELTTEAGPAATTVADLEHCTTAPATGADADGVVAGYEHQGIRVGDPLVRMDSVGGGQPPTRIPFLGEELAASAAYGVVIGMELAQGTKGGDPLRCMGSVGGGHQSPPTGISFLEKELAPTTGRGGEGNQGGGPPVVVIESGVAAERLGGVVVPPLPPPQPPPPSLS